MVKQYGTMNNNNIVRFLSASFCLTNKISNLQNGIFNINQTTPEAQWYVFILINTKFLNDITVNVPRKQIWRWTDKEATGVKHQLQLIANGLPASSKKKRETHIKTSNKEISFSCL